MKTVLKLWAIVAFTFRESFAKKTFIAFFTLSTIVHLFFIFALNVDVIDGALAMIQILGQDVNQAQSTNVQKMIITIQSVISTVVFSGGIFLSIFATANLVPTMLEKGSIELLISKPLPRPMIFIARFIGAQTIMIFNVTYLIFGSWLILSLKTSFWYWPYLYSIPMVIMAFAITYALMSFVGVTTKSAGVSVMVAYSVLFFSPLLVQKDKIYALLSSKVYYYILEGIYQFLPKTFELGELNQSLVMGRPIDSYSALWSSSVAGTVIFIASIYIFSRKDF